MPRSKSKSSPPQLQEARCSNESATVTLEGWSLSSHGQQQEPSRSSSSSWSRAFECLSKYPLILCRLVRRTVVGVHVRKLLRVSFFTKSDPTVHVIPPTLLACKNKSTWSKFKSLLSQKLCRRASRPVPRGGASSMLFGPVIGSSKQASMSVSSQNA